MLILCWSSQSQLGLHGASRQVVPISNLQTSALNRHIYDSKAEVHSEQRASRDSVVFQQHIMVDCIIIGGTTGP